MKAQAEPIHQKFLFDLCDSVLEGELPMAGVCSLGGLARSNMPKAMYLLGLATEGGKETNISMNWETLDVEPERKYINE